MRVLIHFILLLPLAALSQVTNYGKDFYAVFGRNQNTDKSDHRLYIHGPTATTARVEVDVLDFDTMVSVVPGQITIVSLPSQTNATVELTLPNITVRGLAVHITAPQDIAVLCLNYKDFTTDAFLLYPTASLGTAYTIVSMPNSFFGVIGTETLSLFTIAATEDETFLNIYGSDTTQLIMEKGDARMVTLSQVQGDLTGTLVTADKPIAVFSGHERAEIPAGFKQPGSNSTSRDHLYEQLLPNSALGDTLVIAPYSITGTSPELVRIIASQPDTRVSFQGMNLDLQDAGDFFQIDELTSPAVVTSTKPITAGQFMHTASSQQGIGDPSFALIRPTSLYDYQHSFISIPEPTFSQHAVQIICRKPLGTVQLDGFTIPTSAFIEIPSSDFTYANIMIPPGLHGLTSSTPASITPYGFGEIISYAYGGGFGGVPPASVRMQSDAGNLVRIVASASGDLTIYSSSKDRLHFDLRIVDLLGRTVYTRNKIDLPALAKETLSFSYRQFPLFAIVEYRNGSETVLETQVILPN